MTYERYLSERRSVVFPLLALTMVVGIVLGGLIGGRASITGGDRTPFAEPEMPTLAQRLATVDAALARKDVTRATMEWRNAYGLALGSRRWEAMADVGDAAVRIDAVAGRPNGYPTTFRAEARQAYVTALFRARAQRAPAGIARVADAFAALGDAEMAARARAIRVTP